NHKSLRQRSAIVLAGPVANLIQAALLYTGLNLAGATEPAAILAEAPAGTAAAQAGLEPGEGVTSAGGTAVQSWNEARWQLLDVMTDGGRVTLQVQTTDGRLRERSLDFPPGEIEPDGTDLLAEAGLRLAAPKPRVSRVNPGEPGEQAG